MALLCGVQPPPPALNTDERTQAQQRGSDHGGCAQSLGIKRSQGCPLLSVPPSRNQWQGPSLLDTEGRSGLWPHPLGSRSKSQAPSLLFQ